MLEPLKCIIKANHEKLSSLCEEHIKITMFRKVLSIKLSMSRPIESISFDCRNLPHVHDPGQEAGQLHGNVKACSRHEDILGWKSLNPRPNHQIGHPNRITREELASIILELHVHTVKGLLHFIKHFQPFLCYLLCVVSLGQQNPIVRCPHLSKLFYQQSSLGFLKRIQWVKSSCWLQLKKTC